MILKFTLIGCLGLLVMFCLLVGIGFTFKTVEMIRNIPNYYSFFGAVKTIEKLTVTNFFMTMAIYFGALILGMFYGGYILLKLMFSVAKDTFVLEKRENGESSKVESKSGRTQKRRN